MRPPHRATRSSAGGRTGRGVRSGLRVWGLGSAPRLLSSASGASHRQPPASSQQPGQEAQPPPSQEPHGTLLSSGPHIRAGPSGLVASCGPSWRRGWGRAGLPRQLLLLRLSGRRRGVHPQGRPCTDPAPGARRGRGPRSRTTRTDTGSKALVQTAEGGRVRPPVAGTWPALPEGPGLRGGALAGAKALPPSARRLRACSSRGSESRSVLSSSTRLRGVAGGQCVSSPGAGTASL